MSDFIKREDAIKAVIEWYGCKPNDIEAFEKIIEAIPSADRPQGEWIPATWQDERCPERLKKHKCSVCGHKAETVLVKAEFVENYYCNKAEPITEYTHKEQLSKFCPNCGARMFAKDTNVPNKKGADDE